MSYCATPSLFEELDGLFHGLASTKQRCCESPLSCWGAASGEDSDHYFYQVPVPGAKSEDIEVSLDKEKKRLSIKAETKMERADITYHQKAAQKFFYEIPLANVDFQAAVDATCQSGVLELKLKKQKASQPVKVEVKGT